MLPISARSPLAPAAVGDHVPVAPGAPAPAPRAHGAPVVAPSLPVTAPSRAASRATRPAPRTPGAPPRSHSGPRAAVPERAARSAGWPRPVRAWPRTRRSAVPVFRPPVSAPAES